MYLFLLYSLAPRAHTWFLISLRVGNVKIDWLIDWKCVPCREYAKPNRCVFEGFAKVSKTKEEDLKPTSKAFQLLGTRHRKRSQTPVSPMTRNNNVTMSSRSQSQSTRHQRRTSAIVSKISRGRTTQALEHDHTQFVCNTLRVWKPTQIHQGRCNVIKALQAKNQTSSRIQHRL